MSLPHGWVGVDKNYARMKTPGEIYEKESEKILRNQIRNLDFGVEQTVLVSMHLRLVHR